MARYDKYEPIAGGFRAPLAADLTPNAAGEFGPTAVSLDANGRVVVGTGGQSGLVGVLVKNAPRLPWSATTAHMGQVGYNAAAPIGSMAGDIVDVMTMGEIVDLDGAFPAGSAIYTDAAGDLSTTDTGTKVGWTVEADRMVVRVAA
jgi:hypothetical protein